MLKVRETTIKILRCKVVKAQSQMKLMNDRRKVNHDFQIGDFVYVKFQPYRQVSLFIKVVLSFSQSIMVLIRSLKSLGK